jgi:hypothetical protein
MDEGYKVVNRKQELGHVPLREEIVEVEKLGRALGKEGIEFTLVGGSAIGTVIPVTDEWLGQRRVSRLIDIDMDVDSRGRALHALENCGWKPDDPTAYFGIQWGPDGSTKQMCTIENEDILVGRSGFYLSVTYVPTSVYSLGRKGDLRKNAIDHKLTYGETLAYKALRGNQNDIMDLAHASVASDISRFGHDRFSRELVAKHVAHHGFTKIRRNIDEVFAQVSKIAEQGSFSAHKNIDKSLPWLSGMLRL